MPRIEAAGAVSSVWARTLESYKKDLSRKDLLIVEGISSPSDIAKHIEDLEARTHAGKRGAFVDRVHAVTGRLTQFSNVIGAITSSNTEASLIWGSLKLLLTIVHQSSEEYEKICKSILAVSDWFSIVELVTETFNHSELVCDHVVALYTSILRFWSKALKFYKRRRVFNILRAWHDFDSEFGDLERDMKRHGENIEKAAAAVHMNESKTARMEQNAVNRELTEAHRSSEISSRHRDVVRWLAPFNHEASYFVEDFRSACETRHPSTCTWILDKPAFDMWINSGHNGPTTRLLWITGVPGAGKTILSSFVINRCFEVLGQEPSRPILYFFFKNTDSDKNSVLSATRSLLFQLYSSSPANLSADIMSLRDDSGKEKALSEQSLWDLFIKHAKNLANLTIILDALDECVDVDWLIRCLIRLLQSCRAKIFVVSRREENITLALEDYPRIVIGPGDIDADIRSYVTAEIGKIPRFQGKSVQRRMISALESGHGGMFLWAYLMIKELKELGTVRQVDDALKALPTGLEEMHEAIITRLDSTLRKAHRELATKILTWIVCAVRPLRLAELQEILRFEIRQDKTVDQSQIDDDDDLLYSEKDIELACGALVISRNGTLQLIHLSTKEMLMRNPPHMRFGDSRLDFYVDSQRENPQMATLCVAYLSTHLNGIDSVTRPNLKIESRLRLNKESFDSTELVTKSPFIDYASISWQAHLIDGKIGLELEGIMRHLQALLTYDLTTLCIESCVLLHQDIIWTLERSCKEIMSWADYALVPAESPCHQAIGFMWAWSSAVVSILNEYGRIIEEHPYEIHYLDLETLLSDLYAPGPPALPLSFASMPGKTVREHISVIHAPDKCQPETKIQPCRQLQPNLQGSPGNEQLGFVISDSTRNVYFSADPVLWNATEILRVQERASGRRLQPVKSALNVFDISYDNCESPPSHLASSLSRLQAAILSPDGAYLAIVYCLRDVYLITSIWSIERHLDFLNIRDRRPWARRLHCLGSMNYLFNDSCLSLAVGQDGFFYCPSGKIHPERGIHRRIPNSLINTEIENRYRVGRTVELAFAGNGQTMIRLDRNVRLVEKIQWLGDTVTKSLHSGMPENHGLRGQSYLRAISQTARYVVYEAPHEDSCTALFFLLDTVLDTWRYVEQLQLNHAWDLRAMKFHFSKDEKYLFCIGRAKLNHTRFSRWAIYESGIIPQEETNLFVRSGDRVITCTAENDSMIILVDDDRVIHKLDLKRLDFTDDALTTSIGSTFQHQLYCQRHYQVSSDGFRVVGYYINCPESSDTTHDHGKEQPMSLGFRKTRIELKFADLSGTADQMRTIELEYSDPYPSTTHEHVVTFSPDLSLLQAGLHIFDLLTPGHPQLAFPDSPLGNLGDATDSSVAFSSCNGYLRIIKDKDSVVEGEKATLGLFRICRNVSRIERIVTADLEGLAADRILATFHPMLPLLMLTCHTYQRNDVKDFAKSMTVMEIDLETLESIPLTLPIVGEVIQKLLYNSSKALFSNCGSFCFLEVSYTRVAVLRSVLLEKRQAKMQIPAVWDRETSYNGRLYGLDWRGEPTMIRLYQAIDRPHRDGLRDSFDTHREPEQMIAVNITPLPSHLADALYFLLVGKNGDDLVRILFLPRKGPPEIKYLHVTLNQILAELEEVAKAVAPNIEKLFLEEDGRWGGRWQ